MDPLPRPRLDPLTRVSRCGDRQPCLDLATEIDRMGGRGPDTRTSGVQRVSCWARSRLVLVTVRWTGQSAAGTGNASSGAGCWPGPGPGSVMINERRLNQMTDRIHSLQSTMKISTDSPAFVVPVVILIFLGLLKLANVVNSLFTRRSRPAFEKATDDDSGRGHGATRKTRAGGPSHAFKSASSLLDTHGTLVESWASPRPHHAVQLAHGEVEYAGWQNLAIVLLTFYLVTHMWQHRALGSIYRDSGELVSGMLKYLGQYVRDCSILTSVFIGWTFGLQLGITAGLLPLRDRRAQIMLQVISEVGFFTGCLIYAVEQANWPLAQRLFWMAQCVVFVMKLHSYLTVNRHLAAEVALGGPGTGTYGEITASAGTVPREDHHRRAATAAAPGTGSAVGSPHASFTERLSREVGAEEVEAAAAAGLASGTTVPISKPSESSQSSPRAHVQASEHRTTRRRSHRGATHTEPATADAATGTAAQPEQRGSGATLREGAVLHPSLAAINSEGQVTAAQHVRYPANVNLRDFLMFTAAPTVCYEPNFPRTREIRPGYVLEKIFLGLGLLTAMAQVMTNYIHPVLSRAGTMSTLDAVTELLLPMTAFTTCGFFLTFESALNLAAEL